MEAAMAKYMITFSYTPEAWASMIKNPSDRAAAARGAVESIGGRMESMYFMFGERDGMVIYDAPDADAAAAASIAVGSTGAFRSIDTRELIEPERLVGLLGKAGEALISYRPPG